MSLGYLLDTSICIYIAKKRPPEVLQRFTQLGPDDVGMSLITYGELRYGANKSQHRKVALSKLDQLKRHISVQPLLPEVADYYGDVRAQLEKSGTPIGGNDLWIAAHALALNTVLVTNNAREFKRVKTLRVENWVAA